MPTFTTDTTTQNNTSTSDTVDAIGQIDISEARAPLTREYMDRVFSSVLIDRSAGDNRNNFDDYSDEEDIISFEQILNNARTS